MGPRRTPGLPSPRDGTEYVSKLLGYDFFIVYKPGSSNKVVDALSHKDEGVECSSIGGPHWRQWDSLRQQLENDEFLVKIKTEIAAEPELHKNFEVQSGLLFYKGRLVIPRKSEIIPLLF